MSIFQTAATTSAIFSIMLDFTASVSSGAGKTLQRTRFLPALADSTHGRWKDGHSDAKERDH